MAKQASVNHRMYPTRFKEILSKMKFAIVTLSALVFAAPKCPRDQYSFYKGKCLPRCNRKSGLKCNQDGVLLSNECQVFFENGFVSTEFKIIDGECKIPLQCDLAPRNPVCGTGGVLFDNFCKLFESGGVEATDYYYSPSKDRCIKGTPQDPSA